MFCPDTESKVCITSLCPAYTNSEAALCECTICKQKFQTGGSCDQKDHKRLVRVLKTFPYCNKYKIKIKE